MNELVTRGELFAREVALGTKPLAMVASFECPADDPGTYETIQDSCRPLREIADIWQIHFSLYGTAIENGTVYSAYYFTQPKLFEILLAADDLYPSPLQDYVRGKLHGYSDAACLAFIAEQEAKSSEYNTR